MKTLKFCLLIALLAVLISCQKKKNYQLDKNILVALGATDSLLKLKIIKLKLLQIPQIFITI